MRKLIKFASIITIFLSVNVNAQIGYVSVDNEIYKFLDRMHTIGLLFEYNSFEIPKTRKQIVSYIKIINKKSKSLNNIDYNKLSDFNIEFEFDINSSLQNSTSLIPDMDINYIYSEKEKYLYSYNESNKASFFVNFVGMLDYLSESNYESKVNGNSVLYRFGGEFRGSLFNMVGFSVNTTNGSFFGNKTIAKNYSSLKYNYKFNRTSGSNIGESYFDETESYLNLDVDYLQLKIGNDRNLIGHGNHKVLLSNNAPRMEYLNLSLRYKAFNFSFYHGKLLGSQTVEFDVLQGSLNKVSDKYFVYHRMGLNISRHLAIGLGEMIIYANRNLDLSYVNPFNFYKSAEHANQDRDNSMLFFDFQNNTIDGLKLYSTILLDDINFSKIGTGWYGNQTLISLGAYSSLLYKTIPIDMEIQYIKIDPYVFTHRINDNNFTNSNFNLGTPLQPNSSSINFNIYYSPHYRINLDFGLSYSVHGANQVDENEKVTVNNGGNVLIGHRPNDNTKVFFLSRNKEYMREYKFIASYEPINNWRLSLNINYNNNSFSKSQQIEKLSTRLSLYVKL